MEQLWEQYGVVASACLGFLVMLLYFHYGDPRRKELRLRRKRGKAMEDARRAYLYQLVADKITDGLDNAYLADLISREERYELYCWIGKELGIKDLYPRSLLKELVKKEIKQRLNGMTYDLKLRPNLP